MTQLETEIEKVNRICRRRLRPGLQYEGLITGHLNKEVFFEKEGQLSDTHDTLEFMARWVGKYADQTRRIAPMLKGKNLGQTVDNIYRFLYDHFQYNLDAQLQNLYAPSAAWHYRKTGFDCKSFSILASCILTNLSIDHAFRMVSLPDTDFVRYGAIPDFSHVYVVVPDNSRYYVIDATRHENKEVGFIRKHDRPMKVLKHRGLAAPVQLMGLGSEVKPHLMGLGTPLTVVPERPSPRLMGLGCACSGQPLSTNGLGSPAVRKLAIANFHLYLNELEKRGVPRSVTSAITDEVRAAIARGIDPDMAEVIARATARRYGLNGVTPNNVGTMGTAAVGAANGEPQSIAYLAQNLIPKNLIASTFGAVFANGFNLSCWGASLTPQKAGDYMKTYHVPYFSYLTTKIQEATTGAELEKWMNMMIRDVYQLYAFYTIYKPKDADWSSCAKKGIAEYVKFMTALKGKVDTMVSDMQAKGATVKTERFQPLKFTFPTSMTGASSDKVEMKGGRPESYVDHPVLGLATATLCSFSQPQGGQNAVQNPNGTTTVTHANGTQVTYDQNGEVVGTTPAASPEKKGVGVGAIASVGAIAFFLIKILA